MAEATAIGSRASWRGHVGWKRAISNTFGRTWMSLDKGAVKSAVHTYQVTLSCDQGVFQHTSFIGISIWL